MVEQLLDNRSLCFAQRSICRRGFPLLRRPRIPYVERKMIKNKVLCTMALSLTGALFAPVAVAAPVAMGYVSYDVTGLGVAQFDITNETGPNSSLDPTFPVTTSVDLSNLSLDVQFATGPDEIYGPSYFTLSGDGLSWEGTPLSTGIAQPNGLSGAVDAILTGTFDETSLTLYDSSTLTIDPSFSTEIFAVQNPPDLSDGDFGVIYANPGSGPSTVPEPETFLMVGTGLAGLLNLRRRRLFDLVRNSFSRGLMGAGATVALLALLFASPAANASVRLNAWTVPSSGAAGSTIVTLTGSNFPSGGIAPGNVTLSFASTCGGTALATESPNTVVNIIGGTDRLTLLVPASLLTGTYFISLAGTTNSSIPFVSSNCAEINVTHTSTTLAACLPSSSLAVLTGTNVTAYVPNGAWCCGTTGISVVPIEGSGTAATLTTSGKVNSCSSNSATGETVCVDNGTNVYEITGNTITNTLTSNSNTTAGFSGGSCNDCGVAIDALTNTAVITGGFTGGSSGDGLQLLNLATNTFATPFPSAFTVSENVSIDPNRNLILSPDEDDYYDLFKINPDGSLTEYENYQPVGGEFDSAAEDCTTGIALSTQEFTSNLFITDLTQATFTAPSGGNPYGTWTAPSQSVNLYPADDFIFAAGTSGISVAAGTTHLGITMGEFGGNSFAVFQLPATSGTGTPNFVDYVGAYLPATPDSVAFSAGYDPHTITAYTSPNNGKAYGLVADWASSPPSYVAVIDLQALLNATRSGTDAHIVDPSVDLVAAGIVRYVQVP